jgi:hypothetical protein
MLGPSTSAQAAVSNLRGFTPSDFGAEIGNKREVAVDKDEGVELTSEPPNKRTKWTKP